jgi:probable F420-dependent oxidoreductase
MAGSTVGFGMQLPIQSQSTIYVQPWEADAGPAELAAIARAADEAGFLYLAVCDHVAIPRSMADAMSTAWWDTVATLSYLAAVTERTRLLSHIACVGYRHPLVTAKQWLTLDALSGGRTVLGVGAGHVQGEFEALGIDFHRRGALLDEAIDALRAAFADEFSSHEGTAWSWEDMGQKPRPVQPTIPIWVAGSSDAAIRRAARRGDGWLPQGRPEGGMAAAIERLHAWRDEAGRGDQAFTVGALSGPLTGPPEKTAEYLRSIVGLGVQQVQVSFRSSSSDDLCDQIRAFGADVAPLVRET